MDSFLVELQLKIGDFFMLPLFLFFINISYLLRDFIP